MKQIQEFIHKNPITKIALLVFVAIMILMILDGFYILPEDKQAVVTQFGAPVGTPVTTAGLKMKTPFIQKVQYFEKRILIWDGEPNQIPTNDKTFIHINNTARWRISDALLFLQTVGNENRAQTLLNDIISGAVRDMVNQNDLIEVIRSSDWSKEYSVDVQTSTTTATDLIESLDKEASENVSALFPSTKELIRPPERGRDQISQLVLEQSARDALKYGIELIDVMFKRVNYIDSVRERVYARMISERKRIAAERRSQGEGLKAEILGKMERELQEVISEAQRQAAEIRGQADAEAANLYAEAYSNHADFYYFQKSLEVYQDIIGANTSLILAPDSELFKYLESMQ
jgi:modulator of FtsH protease HflC